MLDFINKFTKIEKEIATEKSMSFNLFSLLERQDSEAKSKWDLVIAASWITGVKEEYDYVAKKIVGTLTLEEVNQLSRISYVSPQDAFVHAINSVVSTEHNPIEVTNTVFNNISIRHGYIITSKKSG